MIHEGQGDGLRNHDSELEGSEFGSPSRHFSLYWLSLFCTSSLHTYLGFYISFIYYCSAYRGDGFPGCGRGVPRASPRILLVLQQEMVFLRGHVL
jgi:hypothetical protein